MSDKEDKRFIPLAKGVVLGVLATFCIVSRLVIGYQNNNLMDKLRTADCLVDVYRRLDKSKSTETARDYIEANLIYLKRELQEDLRSRLITSETREYVNHSLRSLEPIVKGTDIKLVN